MVMMVRETKTTPPSTPPARVGPLFVNSGRCIIIDLVPIEYGMSAWDVSCSTHSRKALRKKKYVDAGAVAWGLEMSLLLRCGADLRDGTFLQEP